MTVENEKLLKVIKDIRLTVLADNRVDADEARELLRIAERYAPENADMARFAVMLKDILADGIVDRGESRRIADYLNWLVRETVADEPEQGVLGKFFGLNRNRTNVQDEAVAGVTAFLAMVCVWAMCPFALVSNMGFGWRMALVALVLEGLLVPVVMFVRKVPFFAAVPSAFRKLVTAVIGLAVCIVAVRMAFASGNGVAFADADLTWRTVSVLCCADILMSLFAVLAGGRTALASIVAVLLFALVLAFAPTLLAMPVLAVASVLFVIGCLTVLSAKP